MKKESEIINALYHIIHSDSNLDLEASKLIPSADLLTRESVARFLLTNEGNRRLKFLFDKLL